MKFISMTVHMIVVYGLHKLYDQKLELQNSVVTVCESWLE